MRALPVLAVITLSLSGCDRQPPPEDPNMAAAEDNAVANLQAQAEDGVAPGTTMDGDNLETPQPAPDGNIQ